MASSSLYSSIKFNTFLLSKIIFIIISKNINFTFLCIFKNFIMFLGFSFPYKNIVLIPRLHPNFTFEFHFICRKSLSVTHLLQSIPFQKFFLRFFYYFSLHIFFIYFLNLSNKHYYIFNVNIF